MTQFAPEKSSKNDEETVQQAFIPKPPDGGWGWLVVFGSFMIHVLADGVSYSFGIFFTEFIEEFKSGKGVTSWIGSILVGVTYGSGPLASGLTNRYGCRAVTIVGGVIAAGGCVLSYFATSVYFLMFSFGGVTGLGFGLIYLPAIVSVTMYFEKKRAFATGVAVCGSGVGTFLMAPVIKFLIDQYGWRGAMLIVGALTLNNCLFGALFRPLDVIKEPYVGLDADDDDMLEEEETDECDGELETSVVKGSASALKSSTASCRPSEIAPDEAVDEDDVMPVVLLRHVHGSDTTAAASMPLLVSSRSGKTETHGIARRTRSRDSASSRLTLRRNLFEQHAKKFSREVSGISGGAVSLTADEQNADHNNITTLSADFFNVSSYTKSDTQLAVPLSPTKSVTDPVRNFNSHHSLFVGRSHNNLLPSNSPAGRRSSSGGSPRRRFRHPRYIFDRHPDINLDLIFSDGIGSGKSKTERRTYLAPFSRRDAFFQGSILGLEEYKSAPKLYDVNMLNIRPASPPGHHFVDENENYVADYMDCSSVAVGNDRNVRADKTGEPEPSAAANGSLPLPLLKQRESQEFQWWQKLPEIMRQMLDLSLLKDPVYLLFAISNFLTSLGFNAPYTFLPDRVEKQYAALIVMIIGIANTIGRVVLGMLSDRKWVNRLYLYNSSLALCGIFTALSVCSSHFYWLATYAALFGASMGCYVSLTSVILVDLLSLEKLTNAFGLLLLFQGIASLIGSPLVGWIYDATEAYEIPFVLLGVVIFLSGVMLFVIPCIKREQQRRQQLNQTTPCDRWGVDDPRREMSTAPSVGDDVAMSTLRPAPAALVAHDTIAGQPRRKRNVSFADNNCITTTSTKTKVGGDIHRI